MGSLIMVVSPKVIFLFGGQSAVPSYASRQFNKLISRFTRWFSFLHFLFFIKLNKTAVPSYASRQFNELISRRTRWLSLSDFLFSKRKSEDFFNYKDNLTDDAE